MSLYIPHIIYQTLTTKNKEKTLNTIYLLFVDIDNFTALTREMMSKGELGAELLSQIIQKRMGWMIDGILYNNGDILSFAGDALTALFKKEKDINNAIAHIYNSFDSSPIEKTPFGKFKLTVKFQKSKGRITTHIYNITKHKNFYLINGKGLDILFQSPILKKPKKQFSFPRKTIYKTKQDLSLEQSFINSKILSKTHYGEFRNVFVSFVHIKKRNIQKQLKLLYAIVSTHNGYINKIDYSEKGIYALCLWGAPIATTNPIKKGMECIEELEKNKFIGGFAYGKVFAGFIGNEKRNEYTVLGDIVNTAARLMVFSIKNKKKFTGLTNTLSKHYEFTNIEKIKLKGTGQIKIGKKGKKIETITKIIGRKREYNLINRFLNNKNSVVLQILGPPGIGKSFLAKSFFSSKDSIFITTKENPSPFEIFRIFLFANPNKTPNKNDINNILNTYPPSISSYINIIKDIFLNTYQKNLSLSQKDKIEILTGLFILIIEKLKKNNINNIIIDDARWIDEETKEIIKQTLPKTEELGIKIILISRSYTNIPSHILSVEALQNMEKEFFNFIVGKNFNVDKKIINYIKDKCAGNPYFMKEVIEYLLSNKYIVIKNNFLYIEKSFSSLPSSVENLIISQIDTFSKNISNTIKLSSILGYSFREKLLLQTNDLIHFISKIETGILYATKKSILHKTEKNISFRQSIFRDIVYKMQMPSLRKHIHMTAINILKKDKLKFTDEIIYHAKQINNIQLLKKITTQKIKLLKRKEDYLNIQKYLQVLEPLTLTEEEKADIFFLKGEIEGTNGNYKESINFINQAIKTTKNKANKTKYTSRKAYYMLKNGSFKEGIITLQKAPLSDNTTNLINAMLHLKIGNYIKSKKYLDKTLKIAQTKKDYKILAKAYNTLAVLNSDTGEYLLAIKNYNKAIYYAKQIFNEKHPYIATLYNNIGDSFLSLGNYIKAEEYFSLSLQIRKEILGELHPDISETYNNLSNLYYYKEDYDTSLQLLKKSLQITLKRNRKNSPNLIPIYMNIGSILDELQEYNKSIKNYKKALYIALFTYSEKHKSIANIYTNMGTVYDNMKKIHLAEKYLKKAISIYKNISQTRTLAYANALNNYGEILFKKGNKQQAQQLFMKAIEIYKELKGNKLILAYFEENLKKSQ